MYFEYSIPKLIEKLTQEINKMQEEMTYYRK